MGFCTTKVRTIREFLELSMQCFHDISVEGDEAVFPWSYALWSWLKRLDLGSSPPFTLNLCKHLENCSGLLLHKQNLCFYRNGVTESGSWRAGFAKRNKGTPLALHTSEWITWSWTVKCNFKDGLGINGKNSEVDFMNNITKWAPSWICNQPVS